MRHSDRMLDRPFMYTATRSRSTSSGIDFSRSMARARSWLMVCLVAE